MRARSPAALESLFLFVLPTVSPLCGVGGVLSLSEVCLVTMAQGNHPFPSRTRKLSPAAPMVLPLDGGRVGRCQAFFCLKTTAPCWIIRSRDGLIETFLFCGRAASTSRLSATG